MSASNLHIAWARLFLRAAASAGVTDVVLSPGSRSTPLALAAASTPGLRLHVVVDERSAAFFALGQARVTGRPSLLVCTSGTAGAHYLPAIIEAHEAFVPLIAVTADRPWELQDAAAPQTIDQRKLFGGFVRRYAELGLPDAAPSALAAVPRIAVQAVTSALAPVPGPVHVNAQFRKPLEPVAVSGPEPWQAQIDALMERGGPRVFASSTAPDEAAIAEISARIARAERGLIACGPAPLAAAASRDAILDLARITGFPLLAEATSQLRFGGDARGAIRCSSFDALLRAGLLRGAESPDLVLEIGAPPTSSAYAELAARLGPARFVIAPHGWGDPSSSAAAMIFADPAELARRVGARIAPRAPAAWAEDLARADRIANELAALACSGEALSEAAIARAMIDAPEGALLAIGNSTPVRDLDAYCPASPRSLGVLHQRGASGIDGLVSGAAGARSVASQPVGLLLGDVSLAHDLGALGLLSANASRGPLVAVVVQNGGGRIFDHLPIASISGLDEVYERCFATPPRVDFAHAAAAFGVTFARAGTRAALDEALAAAWSRPGPTLIEAVAPAREGAKRLARLWSDLRARLGGPHTAASPARGRDT